MRSLELMAFSFAASVLAQATPVELQDKGRLLAMEADCSGCHTPETGPPFSGGRGLKTPMGTVFSTNITPSRKHGIGGYTLSQFDRALRKGLKADGTNLYPAMPYASYAGLKDEDVQALYAFLTNGVAASESAPPETALRFPFGLRRSLVIWNALFLQEERHETARSADGAWSRGAYLVNTVAHCATCHTPRGYLLQEQAGSALIGGSMGRWYAPNITSDQVTGVGGWTQVELVGYLRSGSAPGKAEAIGPMAAVIDSSLSLLPDADLSAIAAYLQTAPAPAQASTTTREVGVIHQATEQSIRKATTANPYGASLYRALCANCHGASGQGRPHGAVSTLVSSATVVSGRTDNFIAAILEGAGRKASGPARPMPAFDETSKVQALTDADVAAVVNYVRGIYGHPMDIDAAQVSIIRKGGPAPPVSQLERGIVVLIILGLIMLLIRTKELIRRRGNPHEQNDQSCY